jgi:hypothetical protein
MQPKQTIGQSGVNKEPEADIQPVAAPIQSHPVIAQPKIESTRSNEEQLAQMRAQREASERLGSTLLTPQSLPHAPPPLQPKLTIGQSGDQDEPEADRVARQGVDHKNAPPPIQVLAQMVQPRDALILRVQPGGDQIQAKSDFSRVNTHRSDQSLQKQLIASAAAPLAVFGPIGIGVALTVTTGVLITIWLNHGGWEVIGEIPNAIDQGIDNTLEKVKEILQQAGEVTQNQIEALEDFIRGVFRAQTQDIDPNDPERDGSRDRKLSNGEIQRLKDAGEDIHELKRDCEGGASKCDLYKDRDGNIYVKPKGGRGAGDFTGLNINDF